MTKMKFNDNLTKVREFIKGLVKEDTSSELIASVGEMDKALEEMSQDHETALQQERVAKDKLIEFVTKTPVKDKPDEPTGSDKSFDDILIDKLNEVKD